MVSAISFFIIIYLRGATFLKEYLKVQNKTNDAVISNTFSPDELVRFSKSDYRWVDNRSRPYRYRTVKKGEIYQFEFGKNFQPEMSYEHRGLMIGVKQKLLYVLPIFSYDPSKHSDVYHPVDFPDSKSDLFLLLNDIRTVSVKRILYQQNGTISLSSETYRKIEELVLQKYFPSFKYNYSQMEQELSKLNSTLAEKEASLKSLLYQNKSLKNQINDLNQMLANIKPQ